MLLAAKRPTGTLLWIGPRDEPCFASAHDYCHANVAQLADRDDLTTAIKRPCSDVRAIVFCRENDSAKDQKTFTKLRQMYPGADAFLLVGPMVAGQRPSPSEIYQCPAIAWHQWESSLPPKLAACGVMATHPRFPNSIAVVAESLSNRSALMSIAASGMPAAIACNVSQLSSISNVDEFWWDDSATNGRSWNELLRRASTAADVSHVWIAADVSTISKRQATSAGVGLVITKPGDFSPLVDRVLGVETSSVRVDHKRAA